MPTWDTFTDDDLEEHLEMATGLYEATEDDIWENQQREIAEERERRAEASKAAEAQRRRRERARYDASPEGQIAALRKDLKDAELALAESEKSPTSPRLHPDSALDADPISAARFSAAQTVAELKAQIAERETRLPFNGAADDDLVDHAAALEAELIPLREIVASLDLQAKESGIEDTSFTAQSARRRLTEAESKLAPITFEMALRSRDAQNAALTLDRETRVAMRAREDALARWKGEEARLMAMLNDRDKSGLVDLGELRRVQKAVDMLEKAKANDTPVGKDELLAARQKIAEDTNIQPVGGTAVEIKSWA